ncbi:MAG TPA: hypothetical protein VFV67_31155 [Actinophytocola sp.]|uniref:hypothetical protein n=1 Tax=Actinophytocola sp. TaxID=1872138 RepID=UPI002DB78C8A|nr:hypothetical protein [Actinophytocola sp.]HEU5475126.1 hypothetical protein [Actinophytocola sp.]
MTRRALIIGGTGMLAGCASALIADGWHVVLPSRRYAPIPDTATGNGDRKALWVQADWAEPKQLASRAETALGGRADLLVAWVHGPARPSVLRAVAPLLADGAPVVEVHGSSSANPVGGCPDPVLPDHPTQQVVLGFVRQGGRTRWLTHAETAAGVLDAVRRALDGRPPGVHHVGEFRPYPAHS